MKGESPPAESAAFMPHILTVTMNPALDVFTTIDRLVPAHKLRCTPSLTHPGGGGINVARVLHRMGTDCLALYPAGGPNGQAIDALLDQESVPQHRIDIAQETRESFSVLETQTGRDYRFVLPGPTLQPCEWQACLACIDTLNPAPRHIVASGSLPPGVPEDFYAHLARTAHERGSHLVLDSSGPALQHALQAGVYMFKPSLRELQELTGQPLATDASQLHACRELIRAGQAQVVALSLGAEGALYVTATEAWRAPSLSVDKVATIGAGDSFVAGCLWAIDQALGHETAFRYGMAAAAATLLTSGTALCVPTEVHRLAQQVDITPLAASP